MTGYAVIRARQRRPAHWRRLKAAWNAWYERIANHEEPGPWPSASLPSNITPLSDYMHVRIEGTDQTACGHPLGDPKEIRTAAAWRCIKPGRECPRCIAAGFELPWGSWEGR